MLVYKNMDFKINNCNVCKIPHEIYPDSVFPQPEEVGNMCPNCKADEAMHSYLRALRQKKSLSLSEKFFLMFLR
jgi:hypothetical protein